MTYLEDLKAVVEELYDLGATHVETVPVKEVFEGETIWEGEVEVFDLDGKYEDLTSRVFAWAADYDDLDKPTQYTTILQRPPATTPENAVKAAIVSEFKNDERIH